MEQCACDSGYVLSGKMCVPLEQCGCQSEKFGGYFTLGYTFRSKTCDERKEYTCTTPFGELDELDLGPCPENTQCADGECVTAECPNPSAPRNGNILCSGLAEGAVCNFTCNNGYRMNGEATIICMEESGAFAWDNQEKVDTFIQSNSKYWVMFYS